MGCNFSLSFVCRVEITSRMAPGALFKAFRPIYNDEDAESSNGNINYTVDEQNVSVNLEDRTLVSLS